MKVPSVATASAELLSVLARKHLIVRTAGCFSLTDAARHAVEQTGRSFSLHARFYEEYYQAAARSEAHAQFCERVYGRNLSQRGIANMEQIGLALECLRPGPGDKLLDFGCGDGRITEFMSDHTAADGVGIDIAAGAIKLARARMRLKWPHLSFHWADIETNRGYRRRSKFDIILAVDSIFFCDQRRALRWLLARLKTGGRMAIFYVSPPGVKAADTDLARVFVAMGLAYQVRDLSAHNVQHWARKAAVLQDLKAHFYEEGSQFLFRNRWEECTETFATHGRYLYLAGTA